MLATTDDSLERLEALLPGLAYAVERRNLGEALTEACSRLDSLRPALSKAQECLEVLPLLTVHLQGVQRETVVSRLKSIWALGEQACATKTRSELYQLTRELPRIAEWLNEVERILEEIWKRRVEQEFGPTLALGKVLKEIKDTADLGVEMTRVGAEGQRLPRALPRSQSHREQFSRALQDRDTSSQLLADTGADREVADFLQAVADEKATLGNVTSVVATWLSDHGAAARFRVVL